MNINAEDEYRRLLNDFEYKMKHSTTNKDKIKYRLKLKLLKREFQNKFGLLANVNKTKFEW